MNVTMMIGRLTKDPEVRVTNSGKSVSTFTLAVDRRFSKEKNEADFIPCVAWGKTAEIVGNYCDKGKQVAVAGRIQVRNYETQDGQKRYVTELIVNELELLGRKSDSWNQQSGNSQLGEEEIPF
jgi:single-strand DNA-binding protein